MVRHQRTRYGKSRMAEMLPAQLRRTGEMRGQVDALMTLANGHNLADYIDQGAVMRRLITLLPPPREATPLQRNPNLRPMP